MLAGRQAHSRPHRPDIRKLADRCEPAVRLHGRL